MRPGKNKEAILEASLKLFCNKGFGNTSIKEIATEADVSAGNIYNYFSNKEEIFDSLFCINFPGNFVKIFINEISHIKSLEDNLETVFNKMVSFADDNQYFFKLVILDANEFGGQYLKKYGQDYSSKPIEAYFTNETWLPGLRKDIDSMEFTKFFGWLLYSLGLTDIIYKNNEGSCFKGTSEYKVLLNVLKRGLRD